MKKNVILIIASAVAFILVFLLFSSKFKSPENAMTPPGPSAENEEILLFTLDGEFCGWVHYYELPEDTGTGSGKYWSFIPPTPPSPPSASMSWTSREKSGSVSLTPRAMVPGWTLSALMT